MNRAPPLRSARSWRPSKRSSTSSVPWPPRSPSEANISKAASQTPSLLQRVKRTKTEFQLPYRLGMSRHGAPVRRTQRMPLTVRRLSFIRGAALATVGEKGIENAPFHVRQIASTQCCLPKKKGSLGIIYL
jgi:hypothetical protein